MHKSRIQLLQFEKKDWNLLQGIFQLTGVPLKEWRIGIKEWPVRIIHCYIDWGTKLLELNCRIPDLFFLNDLVALESPRGGILMKWCSGK